MKYIVSIISAIALVLVLVFCAGGVKAEENVEYLRIHIRANSNSQVDQNVKYKVKDAVVEALIPILSEVQSKEDAIKIMTENFSYIESIADEVLHSEGFSYTSHAKINNEYFPSRTYENITLAEGYYDALILELGSGTGNNWWCVVFPAFCFTETKSSDNIVYISHIWEIIKSVMQKHGG